MSDVLGWDDATGRLGPAAGYYAGLGWKVFACHGIVHGKCTCGKVHPEPKNVGKHPLGGRGHLDGSSDRDEVMGIWGGTGGTGEWNVAVSCVGSGFIVVDIDPRNGGLESWDRLEELTAGSMVDTVEAWTGQYGVRGGVARGRHLFYRVKDGESLKGKVDGLAGVDIKHKGYVLVAPSRHGSGLIYEWKDGHAPWERQMAWAPEELLELIRAGGRGGGSGGSEFGVMEWAGEKIDVDALVVRGIPDGERANTLFKIACSVANEVPTRVLETERGKQQVRFTVRSINDKACRPPMEWGGGGDDDFSHQCDNAITFVLENPKDRGLATPEFKEWQEATRGFLDRIGGEGKETGQEILALPESVRETGANLDLPPDVDDPFRPLTGEEMTSGVHRRTPSDVGNGRRLADFYSGSTKYTVGMGWHCWDGSYWRPDPGMQLVKERAKTISSVILREAETLEEDRKEALQKFAIQCKSNAMIGNTIASAQSDPRIDVGVERWDGDDLLLGVQNGVIDLRTGDLRAGAAELFITKKCTATYTPGMRNIRWEQYLDFVTDGDAEYRGWLQRAAGLTLTGKRAQDVMFLVYGLPGTGKTTMVEALFKLLDAENYAHKVDGDLLLARRQPSGADLYSYAEMVGRRMFWIDELPEAEKLKEDKVKALTGSDTLQGRQVAQQPFSFRSKGKLWISTNHRPQIRDDAMWRRIRPIPFWKVPEVDDTTLRGYLHDPEGALPAVLSWAVEGAVRYLGSGEKDPLGWCTKVWEAADMYRQEEDTIRIFLDEETRSVEGGELIMKPLYATYRVWCEDRGERPMTIRPFTQKLLERGEKVDGMGQRAVVKDRAFLPRIVESAGSWDAIVDRSAR